MFGINGLRSGRRHIVAGLIGALAQQAGRDDLGADRLVHLGLIHGEDLGDRNHLQAKLRVGCDRAANADKLPDEIGDLVLI